MKEFINTSTYEFIDISSEAYRTYVFPNGYELTIEQPIKLSVSTSGHRIWDGIKSHYIPSGWVHLFWEVYDGKPNFVK